MGQLVDGQWQVQVVNPETGDGEFKRRPSVFRNYISKEPGSQFSPELGRYHLYVSYACPWANRTLIFRKLKGLEEYFSVSVVSPLMFEDGWTFKKDHDDIPLDHLSPERVFLRDIYTAADPRANTRVTVPILWDKKHQTIVNNESSEIIRMMNSEFNELTGNRLDFYPEQLRPEIDKMNDLVYHKINNGVYKTGFARTQEAYNKNVTELFEALDDLNRLLSDRDYLVGEVLTEADWRLFVTLVRFDLVYFGHFKCNLRRIADYHNLQAYMVKLYNMPGIKEVVHFDHIKTHYYASHESINPTRVVPNGPILDWA